MNIGCGIMAAGMSKRFGSNKLLCDFHGEPMIMRILRATGEAPISHRVVVPRHAEVADICKTAGIPWVLHDYPQRSDTVRLGVEHLLKVCGDLDGIIFAASDQPRLKAESITALCAALEREPGCIHRLSFQGDPGNPVLFPRSLFPALLNLPAGKGGSAVVKAHPELVRTVEASDARELMDVDTPETLQSLL